MLVTEETAKRMWCPFVRQSQEDEPSYNRDRNGNSMTNCLCLGSDCMAWRGIPSYEGKGFCGLAGTPHLYPDIRGV